MTDRYYSIAEAVFAQFSGYLRGVVLAYDITNGAAPAALLDELRAAEASVRERLTLESVADHPRLTAWREAFRALGIKPTEFRPSLEALARRALRGQPLPAINTLADLGNLVSLRYLVPTGGHALDGVTQDLALRPATGAEVFVPFGSDQVEHPAPGEIILVEGQTVLTRRWIWRQSNHTLLLPTTTAIEFNVDALPPVAEPEVAEICAAVMGLIRQYCGGRLRYEVLSQAHPRLRLEW